MSTYYFSPTQERLFLQVFELLAKKAAPGIYDQVLKLDMPTDTVFAGLVNYSLASGTVLQAIKHFVANDFSKNVADKSFLREGSFGSKIIIKYLAASGRPFFNDVLGDFINGILTEDKTWDETKKKFQETIQEKVKTLINLILAQRVQDNVPYGMRAIAFWIAEDAKKYAPDLKLNVLGDFFWNKCFGNALALEEYGLPGANSKKIKKNFTLLAEIFKCFATRTTFGPKHDLNFLNQFITANQDRMDQFVQTLSLPVKQVPEVAIPVEFAVVDYQMMERLLTNVNVVVSLLKPADVPTFTKLAQELQFYRALELFPVDNLGEQNLKLKLIFEAPDHAYETELEGPASVVGTLVSPFLKSIDGARKKVGNQKAKASSVTPAPKAFGSALSDVMLSQSVSSLTASPHTYSIPKFIELMLQELFLKGMDSEGIFRLAGSTPKVQELKQQLNNGDIPDFSTTDVNNLASLLKVYFKELPEPIVTETKFETFMNVADLSDEKSAEELSRLFSQIPTENRHFCFKLLHLMHQVSLNSSVNKMTPENLGIAFGPSFFFRQSQDVTDVQRPITVFKRMICHFETIFKDSIEHAGTGNLVFKKKIIIPESQRELLAIVKDHLLCGYSKNKLRVWNSVDLSFKSELELDSPILGFGLVEGNVWASTEKAISIIDPRENQVLNVVEVPASSLIQVGTFVWTSFVLKKGITIIEIENPTNISELPELQEEVSALGYFGGNVWAASVNQNITVWDAATNRLLHTIPNAHKKKINYFTALSSKKVASCSDDATIAVWSTENYELLNRIDAHSAKIKKIRAFDPIVRKSTPQPAKRQPPAQQPPVPTPIQAPGPSVPQGGPPPGRRPPVPVGRANVAALSRNIVIPGLAPGGPPPALIKKTTPPPATPEGNVPARLINSTSGPLPPVENDFFSCSWDKTIKKWDCDSLHLKEQINGLFSDEVSDLIFILNPKTNTWNMIASGSGLDHSLVLWDMKVGARFE